MKKHLKFAAVLAAAGVLAFVSPALADDSAVIEQLKQQIQVLDQKVRLLERKQELAEEASAEKAKTAPVITLGASGFAFSSADSNFVAVVHGLLQTDNRTFFGNEGIQGNDSFLLRRARPILRGTIFRDFDFMFVGEFGGATVSIVDAYMNYRYRPWLQARVGRFKTPVSLEQLQSDPATTFPERSMVTGLAPNRDVGYMLWGEVAGGVAAYAVGVFNGVGDARNTANADFEDNREFAGRLFFQPFKKTKLAGLQGFGIGAGGSYGNTFGNATGLPGTTGGTLGGYATDGQQQFFAYNPTGGAVVVADGVRWRFLPQAQYYFGPFSLLGEYAFSSQRVRRTTTAPLVSANLKNTAWQVTAGWVLTGEKASFMGITPKKPFSLADHQWGAWQVVARYAALDVDQDAFPLFSDPTSSANGARAWAVGLNWFLNRNLRLSTSYSHTDFSGGGANTTATIPALVTRQPEDVWFTRVQLSF